MQVRDARGRTSVNRDPNKGIAYAGPLAVIVDRNSARLRRFSQGAIQDYRRGIIIGEPTYGKGTVQNLINLDPYSEDQQQPLGQLKLTIAQFFRINGESTQHRGIVPTSCCRVSSPIFPMGKRRSTMPCRLRKLTRRRFPDLRTLRQTFTTAPRSSRQAGVG